MLPLELDTLTSAKEDPFSTLNDMLLRAVVLSS